MWPGDTDTLERKACLLHNIQNYFHDKDTAIQISLWARAVSWQWGLWFPCRLAERRWGLLTMALRRLNMQDKWRHRQPGLGPAPSPSNLVTYSESLWHGSLMLPVRFHQGSECINTLVKHKALCTVDFTKGMVVVITYVCAVPLNAGNFSHPSTTDSPLPSLIVLTVTPYIVCFLHLLFVSPTSM